MNYQKYADKAESLITTYGVSVYVARSGSSAEWTRKYDPVTKRYYWEDGDGVIVWTEPEGTDVEFSGVGIFSKWDTDTINQGLVEDGDQMLIFSGGQKVYSGDEITVGSSTYIAKPPIQYSEPDGATVIVQKVGVHG